MVIATKDAAGGRQREADVEIALHYQPYAEIGGDFYNVIKLDELKARKGTIAQEIVDDLEAALEVQILAAVETSDEEAERAHIEAVLREEGGDLALPLEIGAAVPAELRSDVLRPAALRARLQ